jgi:hypothetical protein
MKADSLLIQAAEVMQERGKQYDKADGERSMGKAVQAFNIITGHSIRESEGWLLMELLKNVRNFTGQKHHTDSLLDGIAYSALKAEAGMAENLEKAWR